MGVLFCCPQPEDNIKPIHIDKKDLRRTVTEKEYALPTGHLAPKVKELRKIKSIEDYYNIGEVLGKGSFGQVILATDKINKQ